MGKVATLAFAAGILWLFTRRWQPRQPAAGVIWAGWRGVLFGICLSSLFALLLIAFTPNVRHQPFHLSIYLLGCNLIFTPMLAAWQVLVRLREIPRQAPAQEKPSFQGMLDEITQPSEGA